MDRKRVFEALFTAHLADRFEEHLALDVADGAADFDDHGLGAGDAADAANARLDLLREVGHSLDRAAEEVAAAFLLDHGVVDLAHAQGAFPRQVFVDEALVVPEVEVGLGAVAGHEDLAVLIRRHGARVDVEVGVELLDGDGDVPALEDATEGRNGNAFAHGANDSAGNEDVLRHGSFGGSGRSARGCACAAARPQFYVMVAFGCQCGYAGMEALQALLD